MRTSLDQHLTDLRSRAEERLDAMLGGQVDDLAWEKSAECRVQSAELNANSVLGTQHTALLKGLEHLHTRKTGALIQASLKLGVLAAHTQRVAPPELLQRFEAYGR